jgi:hypothetical protein
MPIRFRCVYCDKLLGIARRKAGAVVNCPQCGQPLIVPTPEPEPSAAASLPVSPSQHPGKLFEQDDFDVLLEGDATFRNPDPAPAARRPKPTAPQPANPLPPQPFAVEQGLSQGAVTHPPTATPRRQASGGMVLSTGMLILSLLAVLILMGLAFGGGVLVGRMLTSGSG